MIQVILEITLSKILHGNTNVRGVLIPARGLDKTLRILPLLAHISRRATHISGTYI